MGEGPRDKIVFICSGNTCRSPMAQIFLESRARDVPEIAGYGVTSAGLWAPIWEMKIHSYSYPPCDLSQSIGMASRTVTTQKSRRARESAREQRAELSVPKQHHSVSGLGDGVDCEYIPQYHAVRRLSGWSSFGVILPYTA